MILSDSELIKLIENKSIEYYHPEFINPSSIDLTLNKSCKVYTKEAIPKPLHYFNHNHPFIDDWLKFENPDHLDCKLHNKTLQFDIPEEGFILLPEHLYLFSCNEKVKVPNNLCAEVDGKSSLGRLGLTIHVTAGFLDPGFEGSLVLEITTIYPIKIYPNMRICQIKYSTLKGDVFLQYGARKDSKYMNQEGVVESLMYKNFQHGED